MFYDGLNMDYIIGFLLGYFLKEAVRLVKRLSDYDWDNRASYQYDWDSIPYTEDDLP